VKLRVTAIGLFVALSFAVPAHAQETSAPPKNVISVNPFGILLEWFNLEYERVVSESSTVGIGGSTYTDFADGDFTDPTSQVEDERYANADVFFRFYPSGNPLNGWMFGVKAGVTKVTDSGTYAGVGFDVNRSWLLGKRDNFYVGVGFGLKRLFGAPEEDDLVPVVPTFRIVNVGIAF
jgi:hypothetical protein